MGLLAYIVRRSIYTLILLLLVLTLNFILFVAMPGDPVALLASSLRLRPDQVQIVIKMFGLDQPLHVRYVRYLQSMLTFNFGYSYYYGGRPVADLIMERLPNTIVLLGVSTIFAIIIGTIIGAVAAYKRGRRFDVGSITFSLLTTALPTFWTGMMLLLIFGVQLRAFPLAGAISRPPPPEFWSQVLDRLWHLTLPGLTLFLFFYGTFALLARSAVLETLTEDYILTAKAKGLSSRSVLIKHALRNALLPIVTTAAIWLAQVIGGAIITEQIFTYEGMGYLIWMAVLRYDYPVLQACFYIFALAVILANFIADIIYGFIDPRIKY